MKLKSFLLLFLSFSFLSSCTKGEIRYGVKEPFISLEIQEEGKIVDVMPSDILNMIDEEQTFVLLIHSEFCEHCRKLKNEFLLPYLEEHPFYIYGLERVAIDANKEEKDNFDLLISLQEGAFENYQGFPYVAIYEKGNFLVGEQDLNYVPLLFETYLIIDD